jgi:RNA polymerase sigma-70 factor (ECF subfamily)
VKAGNARRPSFIQSHESPHKNDAEAAMQSGAVLRVESATSELELAARAARGDAAAMEAIMRRHNRTLYRAARSILRSDAEAEDAVQETYVRAYQALHQFRGEANLGTWLTRIAVNEAVARLRRRRREDTIVSFDGEFDPDTHASAGTNTPENTAMREQMRAILERHIDALPAAFRTVFVLRALEEMNVDEVAACLDVPAATVRTRYFRARALLRESLERELDAASADAFGFAGARCDRIVAAVLLRIRDLGPPAAPG